MLISRKSRRKSDRFESKFRDSNAADFPLRQYLRCREDFTSGLVHVLLLLAFTVTLVIFGRSVNGLFDQHGDDLSPWARRGALFVIAIFVLSVLRRLYYKVLELRETRREMAALQSEFRMRED